MDLGRKCYDLGNTHRPNKSAPCGTTVGEMCIQNHCPKYIHQLTAWSKPGGNSHRTIALIWSSHVLLEKACCKPCMRRAAILPQALHNAEHSTWAAVVISAGTNSALVQQTKPHLNLLSWLQKQRCIQRDVCASCGWTGSFLQCLPLRCDQLALL